MGSWGGWWEGGVAHKETFLTFEDVDDTQPSIVDVGPCSHLKLLPNL